MEDMDPELSAQVYVDWEYRKKWDSYTMGENRSQLLELVSVEQGIIRPLQVDN